MYFGRGKNKIQDLYSIHDVYDYYTDGVEETYKVEFELYKEVVSAFYKEIMYEVLNNGYEFKFPFRLGSLHIIKRKIKINGLTRFGIDWVETVKLKKRVYHLNPHSKGFVDRFKWEKHNALVPNLYFYKFVASRDNKRMLAKIIKGRKSDYFE